MPKIAIYIRQHGGKRNYKKAQTKQVYPAGTIFVLRYTRQGKREWAILDDVHNYSEAQIAAARKNTELLTEAATIRNNGPLVPVKPRPMHPAPRPVTGPSKDFELDAAIDRYLENVRLKSSKTSSGYGYTLQQFYQSVGRNKPLNSITKQDLYDFVGFMRKGELGDRTIHNRIGEVVTFLRHFGIKDVTLQVKYVEKKVRSYRPDELKALFAAADPEEWILFQFFLCTGVREQEAMNAEWGDVDFVDNLFTIKAKANWTPKDYEERSIRLPGYLMDALKKRMLETKGTLIFPTKEGKLDGHMLRKLQALAKRARLPGKWGLHIFRKSFATLQHRNGTDARTIQKMLGHSDLVTTLAYLEGEDVRSEAMRSSRQPVPSSSGARST